MSQRRPNILLLMTDQQRPDTIAALGNRVIKTPALDRLVREGTSFTRCYTPSPVCVPARACLATGLPAHQTGLTDNGGAAAFQPPTSMMQRLAAVGYQTHGTGKMHFVPDSHYLWGFESRDFSEEVCADPAKDDFLRYLHEQGYDHVADAHGVRSEYYYIPQPSQLPDRLHHSRWVADRSIDFLQKRDKDRPFFLWSSWIKPHPPFESPTPWNKLYRCDQMDEPFRPAGMEDLHTYWNHVQNRYKYRGAGYDANLMRTMRAAYYATISYIDYQIGRLLEALGDEIDNTLILFTADHGEMLGDYGCVGKRTMLDPSAGVPLVARWPAGFEAGAMCDTPVSLIDILPTVCRAGGDEAELPSREGANLVDVAREGGDRIVFSQYQERGYGLYMATHRTGKYIYSEADQREWFFDRINDPDETTSNTDHPDCAKLRQALIERFKQDGYLQPLDGDGWRKYPVRSIPDDPNVGLLYQDTPQTQARIDALGPGYARTATSPGNKSFQLLVPQYDD